MEQLLSLAIGVASNLIARAIPEVAMRRVQQIWRQHRLTFIISVTASVVGGLVVYGIVAGIAAIWPFGGDTFTPPPPTEQQEQASPAEKREYLAEALFGGRDGLEQGETYEDLDLFGDRIVGRGSDCDGYVGGHGAWHVRGKKKRTGVFGMICHSTR